MQAATLYDTTLRDGAQRAGISYSIQDKLRIAHRLDALGVAYIEGGWPGSNPKDEEFFARLRREPLRHARAVAFSSTCRAGSRPEDDVTLRMLVAAETPVVAIFGKSWDFHVLTGLGTTLEENLRMIRESVAYLKSRGREVVYDAEHFFDGYAANPAYALATLQAAHEGGADWLVMCDTNGGTLPGEVARLTQVLKDRFPGASLGIHAHDDSGLGVANSLAAVEAGAAMVQGTINGYGERCGNANLCAVIPNLELKMGRPCLPPGRLGELTSVSHFVSELANLPPWDAQPFVGRNAFTHKAGVHVSALMKDSRMYEHLSPELIGNERHVLVSELSGRANVLHRFEGSMNAAEAAALVKLVKERENQGYQYEGAEASLELISYHGDMPFELLGLRVLLTGGAQSPQTSEASIKLRIGDRVVHTAAEGNGPVNALDTALRKALTEVYPSIACVELVDFKVRVLEGSQGTGALVRVLIESSDGDRAWGTVGVSTNVIEASWQALSDSLAHYLIRSGRLERAVGD
ncbi:MAG TPA: citramalate synthase [Symbiobacteriaceae bacterium]|nr:citramalate synthase [Symbiobacteriaceae bacterium]